MMMGQEKILSPFVESAFWSAGGGAGVIGMCGGIEKNVREDRDVDVSCRF